MIICMPKLSYLTLQVNRSCSFQPQRIRSCATILKGWVYTVHTEQPLEIIGNLWSKAEQKCKRSSFCSEESATSTKNRGLQSTGPAEGRCTSSLVPVLEVCTAARKHFNRKFQIGVVLSGMLPSSAVRLRWFVAFVLKASILCISWRTCRLAQEDFLDIFFLHFFQDWKFNVSEFLIFMMTF